MAKMIFSWIFQQKYSNLHFLFFCVEFFILHKNMGPYDFYLDSEDTKWNFI